MRRTWNDCDDDDDDDDDYKKEKNMNADTVYSAPEIVYEGDLEIQAGSPLRVEPDLEDLDW